MGSKLIDVWAVAESEIGCLPECEPIMIRRTDDIPGVPGNWNEAREIFLAELAMYLRVEENMDEDAVVARVDAVERDMPSVAPARGYWYVIPGTSRVMSVMPEFVSLEEYLACGGELDA